MSYHLVAVAYWNRNGNRIRAHIRKKDDRFYFEGRIRYPDGSHDYFPYEDWTRAPVADRSNVRAVVEQLLKSRGCSEADLANALKDIDECL